MQKLPVMNRTQKTTEEKCRSRNTWACGEAWKCRVAPGINSPMTLRSVSVLAGGPINLWHARERIDIHRRRWFESSRAHH